MRGTASHKAESPILSRSAKRANALVLNVRNPGPACVLLHAAKYSARRYVNQAVVRRLARRAAGRLATPGGSPRLGAIAPGTHRCDVDLMIRVLLLGQWHSLSDRELERALTVRLDFMLSVGQSMIERSPARTTICRFRRMLGLRGLDAALLSEVNRQLQERGLKVGNAPVAVVDATIVESAAPDRGCGRGPRRGRGAAFPGHGVRRHGTKGARRQGAVKRRQPRLPDRGGDPVGDHVPGFPGASPVPAPPPVQPAGVAAAMDRGANLRHPEASVRGGAVPVHGTASRGGRTDLQVDGAEPAQGGQPAPNGETQKKTPAFATVLCLVLPSSGEAGSVQSRPQSATASSNCYPRKRSAIRVPDWLVSHDNVRRHEVWNKARMGNCTQLPLSRTSNMRGTLFVGTRRIINRDALPHI